MKTKIIFVSLFLLLSFAIVRFLKNLWEEALNAGAQDPTTNSKIIPSDYLALFKFPRNIQSTYTKIGKWRQPVSMAFYGNRFYIIIFDYKLNDANTFSLYQSIGETQNSEVASYGKWYNEIGIGKPILVQYKIGPPDEIKKKIYFNLYGSSTKAIKKNDSIAYYFSYLKNLSVRTSIAL